MNITEVRDATERRYLGTLHGRLDSTSVIKETTWVQGLETEGLCVDTGSRVIVMRHVLLRLIDQGMTQQSVANTTCATGQGVYNSDGHYSKSICVWTKI